MRRVKEKLKSNSGATILFAILVFMLCILAGTGALTAAAANSGRYTHLKADQQQYLSVSSAAKLLKGELSGKTFTAKARVEETKDSTGTVSRKADWVTTSSGAKDSAYNGSLKDLLMGRFEELFEYGVYSSAGPLDAGSTLTVISDHPAKLEKKLTLNAGSDVPAVTANLTMGTDASTLTANDFTITIVLNDGEKYASTLTLVATFASGAGENGLNSTQISKETNAAGETTTVTEYTMEVQWLEGNAHVAAVPQPTSP